MKIMEIPPLIKGQKCVLLTAFRSSGAHIALRWEDGNSEERNRRPPVKSNSASVGSIYIRRTRHQLDICPTSAQVVLFVEWKASISDVDLRSFGYHSA